MTPSAPSAARGRAAVASASPRRPWLPLLAVCIGTFILMVDVTVVNVALPQLARTLGTSYASLQWVIDSYALVLAALVLTAGSIADVMGHRRVYVAGLVVFAAASLACGLSPTPGVLVASRAVQGIGGAAMFATSFALLNRHYAGRDRGTAYGVWGAVAGASASVGPVIGGLLAQTLTWRWVFFVNLPFSALAVLLCLHSVRETERAPVHSFDLGGMATFSASAAAATYGLIRIGGSGWSDARGALSLAIAALLAAAFIAVEQQRTRPMLDLDLLRRRHFLGVLVGGAVLTFSAFAVATFTSVWLQSVQGVSPLQASLVGLPVTITSFAVSATVGRFLHGEKAGRHIGIGVLFIGVGGLVGALLMQGPATWTALVPGFLVVGVGVGLTSATLGSAATAAVPPQRAGMATGAVNTARQLGFVFGTAVLGTVFTQRVQTVLAAHGSPDPTATATAVAGGQASPLLAAVPVELRAAVATAVNQAAVAGVQATLLISGLVGLAAGVTVLLLVRPASTQHALRSHQLVALAAGQEPEAQRTGAARSGPTSGLETDLRPCSTGMSPVATARTRSQDAPRALSRLLARARARMTGVVASSPARVD